VGVVVIRYSERPELWCDAAALTREVWPDAYGEIFMAAVTNSLSP
jgi:hypothetical protein